MSLKDTPRKNRKDVKREKDIGFDDSQCVCVCVCLCVRVQGTIKASESL